MLWWVENSGLATLNQIWNQKESVVNEEETIPIEMIYIYNH